MPVLGTLSPQGCGESTLQRRVRKREGFACRTPPSPPPRPERFRSIQGAPAAHWGPSRCALYTRA